MPLRLGRLLPTDMADINWRNVRSSSSSDSDGDVSWNWKRTLRSQQAGVASKNADKDSSEVDFVGSTSEDEEASVNSTCPASNTDGSQLVLLESSKEEGRMFPNYPFEKLHEGNVSKTDQHYSEICVESIPSRLSSHVGDLDSLDFLECSGLGIPGEIEEVGTPSSQSEILFPSPRSEDGICQIKCSLNETISPLATPANLTFMDCLYLSANSESDKSSTETTSTSLNTPRQVRTPERIPSGSQDFVEKLIAGLNSVSLLNAIEGEPDVRNQEVEGTSTNCVHEPKDSQEVTTDDLDLQDEFIKYCRFLFEESVTEGNNHMSSESHLVVPHNECVVYLEQDEETHLPGLISMKGQKFCEPYPDWNITYPSALASLAEDYASSRESSFLPESPAPAPPFQQPAMEKIVQSELCEKPSPRVNCHGSAADSASNEMARLNDISLESLMVHVTVPFSASPVGVKSSSVGSKQTDEDSLFISDTDDEKECDGTSQIGVPLEVPDKDDSFAVSAALVKKCTRFRVKPKSQKNVDICEGDDDEFAEIPKHMAKLPPGTSKCQSNSAKRTSTVLRGVVEENQEVAYNPFTVKHEDFYGDVLKTVDKMADIIERMPLPENKVQPTVVPMDFIPLYDHQRYGLQWLRWRETQYPGGGILADEMGLGKTVMIIALIMKSKQDDLERQENLNNDLEAPRNCIPSKSTLICCPLGCLHQWNKEIESKGATVSTLMYYGKTKIPSASQLAKLDVVLTTYETIMNEFSVNIKDPFKKSPLKRVYWKRIVLDEAHTIRNPKSKTSLAIDKLKAKHRWAVTGTPIHNKPEDLFAIVKFLKMKPFDEPKVWKHWIGMNKVKPGTAAENRFYTLGKALILRRTKKEVMDAGGSVECILPKTVEIVEVELKREERQVYDYLLQFCRSIFAEFMKSKKERVRELGLMTEVNCGMPRKIKYAQVLTLLMRLRQCVVLPHLLYTMLEDDEDECEVDNVDIMDANSNSFISKKNPVFSREYKSSKFEKNRPGTDTQFFYFNNIMCDDSPL